MKNISELKEIKLQDLKQKTPAELVTLAEELQVENASALRIAEMLAAHPDLRLMLLDLGLPGESGLDALPMLRENHPHLPVVVLSASEQPGIVIDFGTAVTFDVLSADHHYIGGVIEIGRAHV